MVHVHDQGYLICKNLFYVHYNEDTEVMSADIKNKLDCYFKDDDRRRKKKNNFKNWNGYLDKRSQREGKINQLLND